ncbi:MAG: hypothetical protein E7253_10585 [Lachnospiraceae bacterium]|nr:hypothetical protein [Lachnospiraceae bacterium]
MKEKIELEKELRIKRDKQRINALTLMDDDFMTKCFDGDIESVELILRIILKRNDLRVVDVHVQQVIKNLQGKSKILDIYAHDIEGKIYNIEIQNKKEGANPKRARYHSSLLDANLLEAGMEENNLTETYIIFITRTDMWGHNLPVYYIERVNLQTGDMFHDQAHIVYVNGSYQEDDPIGRLMHDFSCPNPDNMYYKLLADKTKKYKDLDERGENMGYIQEIREEEREIIAVRLLKKGMLTIEEIAECAEISCERIRELLEQNKELTI